MSLMTCEETHRKLLLMIHVGVFTSINWLASEDPPSFLFIYVVMFFILCCVIAAVTCSGMFSPVRLHPPSCSRHFQSRLHNYRHFVAARFDVVGPSSAVDEMMFAIHSLVI